MSELHYELQNESVRVQKGLCGLVHNRKHGTKMFGGFTKVQKKVTCEWCWAKISFGALKGVNVYEPKDSPYQKWAHAKVHLPNVDGSCSCNGKLYCPVEGKGGKKRGRNRAGSRPRPVARVPDGTGKRAKKVAPRKGVSVGAAHGKRKGQGEQTSFL